MSHDKKALTTEQLVSNLAKILQQFNKDIDGDHVDVPGPSTVDTSEKDARHKELKRKFAYTGALPTKPKYLAVTVENIVKKKINLSDHVYSAMTVEECLFPMAPLFTICCYDKMSNSYGVIIIENKRFFCTTWKKNTCRHTSVCTMMRNSKDRDRYPEESKLVKLTRMSMQHGIAKVHQRQ